MVSLTFADHLKTNQKYYVAAKVSVFNDNTQSVLNRLMPFLIGLQRVGVDCD